MGLSTELKLLVGVGTCLLCEKEFCTPNQKLGPLCNQKLWRTPRVQLLSNGTVVISFFPYAMPEIQKAVLNAKLNFCPYSITLVQILWDEALKRCQLLPPPESAMVTGVPRPFLRRMMKGPGLIPEFLKNRQLRSYKKMKVFRAQSLFSKKKPHTTFRIKKFTHHSRVLDISNLLIIDDLFTTGTTLGQLSSLAIKAGFKPLGLTFAYASKSSSQVGPDFYLEESRVDASSTGFGQVTSRRPHST